jgi:hypothetical protein
VFGVRYVLPAALLVAGLVCLLVGSRFAVEAWAMFTGAGLAVFFLNLLYRMGVRGDEERSHEEAAREHFAEHGEWPEEQEERAGRRWTLAPGVETAEDEERRRGVSARPSSAPRSPGRTRR